MHFNGGSMATTTNQCQCLWFYHVFAESERRQTLQVADNTKHHPVGFGFLCVPTTTGSCFIRCLHTPTLPATIVSPFDAGIQHGCCGYSSTSSFDGARCTVCLHFAPEVNTDNLCFPQNLHQGLLFSNPIILPSAAQHSAPIPRDLPNHEAVAVMHHASLIVQQLSREQQRILWHQRLGHIHARRVSEAHKFATGIPVLPNASDLDKCPICARAKLHKAARGTATSRRATQCFQGISIDFGFIVQTSNADSARVKCLQGMHGETCYCLIVDHFSGMLFGQCFHSKAPPLNNLSQWLATHGLSNAVPDRYV
jgi:hypothetical protein